MDQGNTKTFPGAVTVSTNGSRQNQVSYRLDGANNNDLYTNTNQPFPFPDALQEFSVQTSNYGARYGGNAGGVVNVVTKSGTNSLHGDAFEFVRNARIQCPQLLRSRPRSAEDGTSSAERSAARLSFRSSTTAKTRRSSFSDTRALASGTLGIVQTATLPTAAERGGNFSALLDANSPANPFRQIHSVAG